MHAVGSGIMGERAAFGEKMKFSPLNLSSATTRAAYIDSKADRPIHHPNPTSKPAGTTVRNGVLGHNSTLSRFYTVRLYWAGDNLG